MNYYNNLLFFIQKVLIIFPRGKILHFALYILNKKGVLKTDKLMFIVLAIMFAFIGLIAIDGDYMRKEMQKDYEKYKEICTPEKKSKKKK